MYWGDGHLRERVGALSETARERIYQAADSRKDGLLGRLDGWLSLVDDIAARIDQQGGAAAQWSGALKSRVHGLADGLKTRSTDQLLDELEAGIRARPGLFVAGCALLGFLGVRLMRS